MTIARMLLLVPALLLSTTACAGERILLERRSPYNTILVTEDDRGLRVLRFEAGGARQSVVKVGDPDHLELPYARAIPLALAFVEKPEHVLVVGLGGGTVPSFLHRRRPELAIDVVEIDPGVVEVAKSHFGFIEDARMRAYVEDGRRFIEQRQARYDIVVLDAFGTETVPYRLVTREFLQSVRRALKPRGVAVGNLWSRESNRLYDSMVRTYLAVYDDVSIVDMPGGGNKLVIALPWKPAPTVAELVQSARVLTQSLGMRYDLGQMAAQGYRAPGIDGMSGRILTDAQAPASLGTPAPLAR
jgi:spermidine synthase